MFVSANVYVLGRGGKGKLSVECASVLIAFFRIIWCFQYITEGVVLLIFAFSVCVGYQKLKSWKLICCNCRLETNVLMWL